MLIAGAFKEYQVGIKEQSIDVYPHYSLYVRLPSIYPLENIHLPYTRENVVLGKNHYGTALYDVLLWIPPTKQATD